MKLKRMTLLKKHRAVEFANVETVGVDQTMVTLIAQRYCWGMAKCVMRMDIINDNDNTYTMFSSEILQIC